MGHPTEIVMTPAMVKYLYEGAVRADRDRDKRRDPGKHKEPQKLAEDLLAAFFSKLAMAKPSVPKPRLMSDGAAASNAVMKFTSPPGSPGTMATSRMGAPKPPGVKSVKEPDSVVNLRVRLQDAMRKGTPAVKSPGLGGPGPMNVGT